MKASHLLTFILLLVAGCQTTNITEPTAGQAPDYSIIYVIHGDANYLYHNAEGTPLQADLQVLAEAKQVAKNAASGEVFIFHQKPEQQILWLFPRKDRQLLHYRNGVLKNKIKYSPTSDTASFTREAQLYQHYTARPSDPMTDRYFLYFGHEVPARPYSAYHASRRSVPFTTNIFAEGVGSFLPGETNSFDLSVVSTCNNGTPLMVEALSSFTGLILASPQNLHLSHVDTYGLSGMLENNTDSKRVADTLATQTYNRLTAFLQTAVTLSVYDTERTDSYTPALARHYEDYLETLDEESLLNDNGDCARLPFFQPGEMGSGVKTWYQPPQFGVKGETAAGHSGWGCK